MKTKPRSSSLLGFVAVAFVAGACGGGLDHGYAPPLVVFQGSIVSSALQAPSGVNVAFVWRAEPSAALKAVQSVTVRPEFPARFRLEITHVPPPEAMNRISAAEAASQGIEPFSMALGTIVAYEDRNGNGTLDPVAIAQDSGSDVVLGVPERITVLYIEGTPPPPSQMLGLALQRGFNLIREPRTLDADPSSAPNCAARSEGEYELLPLTSSIDIALTAEPSLSRHLCQNLGGQSGAGCGRPQDCVNVPGARITCTNDNTAYCLKACTTTSLCGAIECIYSGAKLSPGELAPSWWPCPVR